MKKIRTILAILFLTDFFIAIAHFLFTFILGIEFYLVIYLWVPIAVLFVMLLCYLLEPILNWIIGD